MAKHIPLPAELEFLIEKRTSDDRRKQKRASNKGRRATDAQATKKNTASKPKRS